MKAVTAAQMRAIDRAAIEDRGVPGIELMERAGAEIARGVMETVPEGGVLVLCGAGNNGGDGYVAARQLRRWGRVVRVMAVLPAAKLAGDARTAFDRYVESGGDVAGYEGGDQLAGLLDASAVVVDAMLGTGAKPPLRPPIDAVVAALNVAGLPVVAADVPTGLDSDTGEGSLVVRCHLTVTIGLPKLGLLSCNGVAHAGRVWVEGINFPPGLLDDPGLTNNTLTLGEAAALLPARPRDGHKGTFGFVTLMAGSSGMPGAAMIAAEGALRSGAGLVWLVAPGEVRRHAAGRLPEALHRVLPGMPEDTLAPMGRDAWRMLAGPTRAFVFGPGVTTAPQVADTLSQLLDHADCPLVLDADGLNLVAAKPKLKAKLTSRCVLTPHPGELGRLLGAGAGDIQRDRWASARRAAQEFQCVVVLKGYGTLVAEPSGQVFHVPTGNTALAKGGSGDLLGGVVGGLLAQGLAPRPAACLGAFACGLAADLLCRDKSARGVTVTDVAAALPLAFRELEEAHHGNR